MTNLYDEVLNDIRAGGVFATDFAGMMLGAVLGAGESRIVFQNKLDSSTVIKVERRSKSFHNVAEWDTWNNFIDTPLEPWLAPCLDISSCGIYLIQRKTVVAAAKDYPEKVPTFFTDTKYSNWGLYDDRLVCHDYANSTLYRPGAHKNLVNAQWWKELHDHQH